LRQVLGNEAHQAGSYNKAGFMRLDFSWNQALSQATKSEIEEIANLKVRENLEVETRIMNLDEAKSLGAMALFGEKYGETVRVVEIGGPWSLELCAGTHVTRSSEIGLIDLVSESSVGSTSRRVEALVGLEAFRDLAAERAIVGELTSNLKTPREQLPERIAELVANLKAAEKRIAQFEAKALGERVPAIAANAKRVGDVLLVAENVGTVAGADELRQLVTSVRDKLGTQAAVVALAASVDGKPSVVIGTNAEARTGGAKAGALAKIAAGILGGGGGGKDDMAQGGGSDVNAIGAALKAVTAAVAG
jgi:alanyl-tRNA synthetase